MSDEIIPEDLNEDNAGLPDNADEGADSLMEPAPAEGQHFNPDSDAITHHLRGMYRRWYLEYASYVILERAVPHIDDGLKPVQRRILHSMQTLDDGRFNKVANIVGNTMQYHPHGDASIKDALVQLGQKELLIDMQGNWGNILTGAPAAAGRYIEARLSTFALETLFNAKVTDWTMSYDGRKREPVTLPVKFPLLLAQGAEGIAVGLSSKILPHNVNEILDAAVAHLRGESFELFPDFPTGGFIDVARYNDGQRGGRVRVRAKIDKVDNKTLVISEIPFGKTTETLIDSIIEAYEKGKIKIRKVENMTSETARILVHLQPGTSSDKTIDALYAFTDCEISLSPNCCVISEEKPMFVGVSDLLRHSVDRTRRILQRELEILRDEVREKLHFASLEKIFIEKRIYKDKEYEQAPDMDAAVEHVTGKILKYAKSLLREVTRDDILRLFEIRMKRILRFNAEEADEQIAAFKAKIADYTDQIEHITDFAIAWYEHLKEKYGAAFPRRTLVRSFDNIQAASVAEANEKLYINREDGFIGTALKKDEFVCNCSAIDDIIIFMKDGRYKVVRVADKLSVGKNVMHVAVFKRGDTRTIYNAIYQNGKNGPYYMKRFYVTGVTRDKEYNMTPGLPGTRVSYFTANPNGEAEVVKVILKPDSRLKKLQFDVDFSKLSIKGRASLGNLVTKNPVHRFTLKEAGRSTLGGLQVWFDPDVLRLNYEGRGESLGEFGPDDQVLVVLRDGSYYTSGFESTNHYEDNILRIEKFDSDKVWTAILQDADQGYPYLKRFRFEPSAKKQKFIGENQQSELIMLSDKEGARFSVAFGGGDSFREALEVVAAEFVGVKSSKAKGKRLTTYEFGEVTELTPVEVAEPAPDDDASDEQPLDPEPVEPEVSDDEIRDELTGQQRLF